MTNLFKSIFIILLFTNFSVSADYAIKVMKKAQLLQLAGKGAINPLCRSEHAKGCFLGTQPECMTYLAKAQDICIKQHGPNMPEEYHSPAESMTAVKPVTDCIIKTARSLEAKNGKLKKTPKCRAD